MSIERLSQRLQKMGERLAGVGNHDFCPWANGYVYWLKQPIGWFVVGAFASLLIALFLSPHAWITFGSLVIVMMLGVVWPWAAVRGMRGEIAFDRRRCHEGELVHVRLTIRNAWPVPLWGLAVEKGFFTVGHDTDEQPVTALASVPGWSKSEFVFEFRPSRRGVYPHTIPELVTGFPFGLWRAQRPVTVSRDLLVWPQTTTLASIPALDGEISDVIGMLFDRPGNEGDMIGARVYRQGDRLRSIHWAQTARRDTFIVTERQAAARRLVVVSCDVDAFRDDGDGELLENAIRVAASVTREFHAHHAQVRVLIGGLDVTLEPGLLGLHRLLDALARYRPDDTLSRATDTSDALTLRVTTSERQSAQTVDTHRGRTRYILLDPADVPVARNGPTWIKIRGNANHSEQLRSQWERLCHDSTAS